MPDQEEFDLRDAPQLDVYKWSEYKEVNAAVQTLTAEIEAFYLANNKQFREPKKAWRYIKVIVIGLWAAVKLDEMPWRSISRDQAQYRSSRESRYNKLHMKAKMLKFVDDLIQLGYIQQKIGYQNSETGKSFRTRIRATPKLISLIDGHGVDELAKRVGQVNTLSQLMSSPETGRPIKSRESIRLKDSDGNLIDYRDTRATNLMRKNLTIINQKLENAHITLRLTDEQFTGMWAVLKGKREKDSRRYVDFSQTSLHRVFNGSFDLGGRFYGGWWECVPREFRPYIEINHLSTVELDYSGHHVRMLYAREGLQMPDEPYDLEGFDRDDQKTAVMIILNAYEESKALKAISSKGIAEGHELMAKLKERHAPIAKYFHTGVGLSLQNNDAKIAESLMLQMIERSNAVILPIHDSFLVSKGYEQELLEAMNDAFVGAFDQMAKIEPKKTALKLESKQMNPEDKDERLEECLDDLEDMFNLYTTYHQIFGY